MDNSTFFAAMAGANGRDADDWANYAHRLEQQVAELQKTVRAWQECAVAEAAKSAAKGDMLTRLTGKEVTEAMGGTARYRELRKEKEPVVRALLFGQ